MLNSKILTKSIGGGSITLSLMIYIFFIKLKFFPYYAILPYLAIGTISFIFLLYRKIEKKYIYYICLFISLTLYSLFSYSINIEPDLYYLKEVIVIGLVYFLSAFGIRQMFKWFGYVFNEKNLLFFSINAWILNIIISVLANLDTNLFSIFTNIINLDGLSNESLSNLAEARFVGMGASFFGFGIVNSFFLILLAYYIIKYVDHHKYLYWIALYLCIGIVGLLFSRTTILGIILSMILLCSSFKNIKIMLNSLVIISLLVPTIVFFSDSFSEKILFGLQFLIDFEDSQAADSTSVLQSMWQVLPQNTETWLFGDSRYKYVDAFGNFVGYYKHIDVGYLRIIFANGLVGLTILFMYFIYIFKKSFLDIRLVIFLFTCLMSLNIKGVAMPYCFTFLFFIMERAKMLK